LCPTLAAGLKHCLCRLLYREIRASGARPQGKVHNNNMWFHADKLRRPKQCWTDPRGAGIKGIRHWTEHELRSRPGNFRTIANGIKPPTSSRLQQHRESQRVRVIFQYVIGAAKATVWRLFSRRRNPSQFGDTTIRKSRKSCSRFSKTNKILDTTAVVCSITMRHSERILKLKRHLVRLMRYTHLFTNLIYFP
jgi:hypothetical protein